MSSEYLTVKEFEEYKKALLNVSTGQVVEKVEKVEEVKKKRAASEYNIFLKTKLAEYKKEDPSIKNKDAFSKAAKEWSDNKKDKLAK